MADGNAEQVRTALYRHFNMDGDLLYVGISLNAIARLIQHRVTAEWFDQIARIEVSWFPTRAEAEQAERAAIEAESPIHNVAHAPTMPPALVAMLRKIGKLHMVDKNGHLLPEYATLGPGEASDLARKLG